MPDNRIKLSEAVRLVSTDDRLARAILRDPSIMRDIVDIDAEPESEGEKLGMSDAMRIASKNEEFAKSLMTNPEAFRNTFNFSDAELKAIKTIPGAADLATQFSYDA